MWVLGENFVFIGDFLLHHFRKQSCLGSPFYVDVAFGNWIQVLSFGAALCKNRQESFTHGFETMMITVKADYFRRCCKIMISIILSFLLHSLVSILLE